MLERSDSILSKGSSSQSAPWKEKEKGNISYLVNDSWAGSDYFKNDVLYE